MEGESGIGKTALLEQLERDAADAGLQTALARCVEVGGTPAFWPLTQIVRRLGADSVSSAAGRYAPYLLPLLPGDAEMAPAEPQSYRVAEGLTAALETMATSRPVALFVDDLFGADPDSLTASTMLVAEIESLPLIIVATHRGEDLGADALTATLSQMVRFAWVERMPVQPLTLDELAHIVSDHVDSAVDDATVATIHARSSGNPFYAVELSRLLASDEGHNAAEAVPPTVLQVVERRLDRLSQETRLLIRAGAICGREFDLDVVRAATDLDLEAALAGIDEALQAGFIHETDVVGRYRFSHLMVVHSLSRSLSAIRRAHANQRLADSLEQRQGHLPARWAQIAHHRCEAIPVDGAVPAIHALARAGAEAVSANAFESANELLDRRHALVLGQPPNADRDRAEMASLIDLGRVWTWRDGYSSDRLRRASDRMMELTGPDTRSPSSDRIAPPTEHALAALFARFSLELVAGDLLAASRIVDRLQGLAEQRREPSVDFALHMATAMRDTLAGQVGAAIAASGRAEAALDILEPDRDGRARMPLGEISARLTQSGFAGWANWLAGDRHRARTELAHCRRLCERSDDGFARFFCVTVEGRVAAMDDSPEWVEDVLAWHATPAEDILIDANRVWPSLLAAWADGRLRGDPNEAAAAIRSGLDSLEQVGALNAHSLYWGLVADLELGAGDPASALEAAGRGLAHAERSGERFWFPELQRLTAEACSRLGRTDQAREARSAGLDAARSLGIVPLQHRLAGGDEPPASGC